MRIRHKLIVGFVGIASLAGAVGLLCVSAAQKALQDAIGQRCVAVAAERLDKVDREIHRAIRGLRECCADRALQQALERSNRRFEKRQNLRVSIDNEHAQWASAEPGATISSIEELDANLCRELKERLEFHEKNTCCERLGPTLVTNKYGAIVALSGATSTYKRDNEPWWRKAKRDGLYVGSVHYDQKTGTYSIDVAVRAENPQKEFVGVLKTVLNVQEAIDVIRGGTGAVAGPNVAGLTLFDRDGRVIYDASGGHESSVSASDSPFLDPTAADNGYLLKTQQETNLPEDRLLAYARTKRHGGDKGLGWVLTMEYPTAELFAPVASLKHIVLGASLLLVLAALMAGLVVCRLITRPLSTLKATAERIRRGDLSARVHVKAKDEIAQLADVLNHMAEQRSRAENALGTSEAKLNAILHAIADEITLIDENLNIVWTNDAAKRTYGDDIIGKKCYEVYHQRSTPCEPHPCPALQTFRDGKVHHYEAQVTNKQGMTKYLDIIANVAFRNEDGNPATVLEICRDITDRKQVEGALDKLNRDLEATNLELTRTNKDIEEFAYITAHDLKTPLRAIGTLADWIAADYADKFDEQGREQVKLLVSKAKQMTALIDDILKYSGLGRNDVRKEEVDLNVVVREVMAAINPPEHIQIVSESGLPSLVCKKTHIMQIFQNLLTNAVKYMDKPDGRIIIGCTERENSWQFTVADNGPGIEKKHFEKIFKMFQTLAPREGVESTGIGLSIVKKLVELNNGRVWLESELGKGSTFFFTLPKVCPVPDAGASQPPQQ